LVDEGKVPRERLFVAPVSFRQAIPDDYQAARKLADELGVGTYTHIAETTQEVEGIIEEYGERPIHFLHELGFSGPNTVLVHCVLLEDSEIERLAENRTTVVHCPSNHMKLAKGVTRVPDLLKAGVNMTLGVDLMENLWIEMREGPWGWRGSWAFWPPEPWRTSQWWTSAGRPAIPSSMPSTTCCGGRKRRT
jgi:cytosine/adenosine deaminase-related metal-dependent hydrolase